MDTVPLRVAFNATPLLSSLTGIGNYIVQLGAALAATGRVDAYSYYRYCWRRERPQPPRAMSDHGRAVKQRIRQLIPFRAHVRPIVDRLGFARGLRRFGIEVYHEQNYIPVAYDIPVVVTIHDLSWIRYPETQPADRVRWLERSLPKAIDRASAILVDSDFVRSEVVSTFGVSPERIRTAHLGVAKEFRPSAAEETADTLRAHGLAHGQYVLTVGTIEPRKNIGRVLEAFALLPAELRERYPLVVAGAQGWHAAGLLTRLHSLADSGQIRFLGQVSSADLPRLYAGASLFVFPSLYEGFGLPPLEAMASGIPVIVSDRASLPEVVGDAGWTVDPERPDEIARRMAALLSDPAARADLSQRGLARASLFSWDACAGATLATYRSVLGVS